jgi:hypothetical protein
MSYKVTDTIVVDQNKNLGSIGIATFAGPLLIGGGSSTGTVSQPLQVLGTNGAYIGGNLGIGSTNPSSKLWVSGDIYNAGIHTAQVLSASKDPGSGIGTDFTNSLFGNGWRVSSPGSTTYYKLATLPAGGGGNTFDHLTINGVLGAWTNGNQTPFEITFANRGAFNYKYVSYGSVRSDVRIIGISTNSTVEIWAQHQASQFTKLVYNIANSIQAIVVSNPTSTTTAPVGTTVFDSSTATPRFIINESDNVGIGTISPTSKLQVVGDVLVSGIVTANSFRGDGSLLTGISGGVSISTNTTNQSQYLTYVTGTGNTTGLGVSITGLVFNPSSGNLGIGTTAPLQKLHVLGNLLVAAGSSTGQHITQKAYELNSGTLSWEGSAGQLFSITNNLTSGSIFSVNDVSGIPSIDVDANGTISLGAFGGNIGIGTTNATSKLDIFGNVKVTGITTLGITTTTNLTSQTLNVSGISTFQSTTLIGTTTSTGTASQLLQVTGGAYVSGNTGIGTTRPTSKLQVVGDVLVSGIVTATAFSGDVFNAYPFYSGITSSAYASPTGVLTPIITFPSTANKRYIVHSINVANTARRQPTGAGATVSINTLAGAVTSVTINAVGTGYTAGDIGSSTNLNVSFATTSFVGVGTTGDPAYAGITSALGYVTAVSGGCPTGVAVTFGGFGYTSAPVVTFAAPAAGGTRETGTAVLTLGEVTAAYLNVPGEGYTTPPSVSIASTSGIGVSITADVDSDGKIIRLNLLNRGYGYSKLNQYGNSEENEVYISQPGLAKTEVGVDVTFDRVPVGGGTTVQSYIAYDVPIPVGGVVEILKQPAVLNPSDIIQIRGVDVYGSGLSGAIDVCISYEETNNTNFIGYGTATGANVGLGISVPNIGILTATTYPIMLQSLRLTNTEFVGDYDVSIKVITGAGQTFYLARNLMIPSFASVELCDTPKRLEIGSRLLMDAETVGIDANLAQTIDIQVSGRNITL